MVCARTESSVEFPICVKHGTANSKNAESVRQPVNRWQETLGMTLLEYVESNREAHLNELKELNLPTVFEVRFLLSSSATNLRKTSSCKARCFFKFVDNFPDKCASQVLHLDLFVISENTK